jgi:hypothetical protein
VIEGLAVRVQLAVGIAHGVQIGQSDWQIEQHVGFRGGPGDGVGADVDRLLTVKAAGLGDALGSCPEAWCRRPPS